MGLDRMGVRIGDLRLVNRTMYLVVGIDPVTTDVTVCYSYYGKFLISTNTWHITEASTDELISEGINET